jgi:NTE family protein
MSRPIRIGLALSGGTMKSVAHVGVLKALEEAGIEIERITATSGGTIVASHYAAGIPVRTLEERAVSMRLSDLGRVGFRRLGFLSSERIYALVANAIGEMRFEQLNVPLGIVVTNLLTGAPEVIESGIVAKAAQASCCIPQIYAPVEMNGSLYVDGSGSSIRRSSSG